MVEEAAGEVRLVSGPKRAVVAAFLRKSCALMAHPKARHVPDMMARSTRPSSRAACGLHQSTVHPRGRCGRATFVLISRGRAL
jgi:hypothetical protein